MNKKILLSILFFIIVLVSSSICFAADNSNLGSELQNSFEKSKGAIENVGNGIKDMAEGAGSGMQGMAENMGNEIQNMFGGGYVNSSVTESSNTESYTATRTSADVTGNRMANTAWIWLILGITGIVIIALTWYYVSQDNDKH